MSPVLTCVIAAPPARKSSSIALLQIARDPDRLGEFMNRLQERARATGQSTDVQKQAVLRLLKNLATYALQHSPDEFDEVMTNVATATTRLNADVMLALLTEPPPQAGASGHVEDGIDIGGELRSRFNEEQLGAFIAENVARDRGATGRLAEAFNSLATSDDQRRTALALAEERVSLTPLGDDPQFNEIWADTVAMLMSYSDADYVPDQYDRELTAPARWRLRWNRSVTTRPTASPHGCPRSTTTTCAPSTSRCWWTCCASRIGPRPGRRCWSWRSPTSSSSSWSAIWSWRATCWTRCPAWPGPPTRRSRHRRMPRSRA